MSRLPRRKSRLILGAVVALALLSGSGVWLATRGPSKAELMARRAAAARDAEEQRRAAIVPDFEQGMKQRDELFLAERQFVSAMGDVNRTLSTYRKRVAAVDAENKQLDTAYAPQFEACRQSAYAACPSPDYAQYPEAPDVSPQVAKLRDAAKRTTELKAKLQAISPRRELQLFYTLLTSATEALRTDAAYNADMLTEGIDTANDGEGGGKVDEAKLKTLREETALPAIRQLNVAASALIGDLDLPIAKYDVPGGRDLDPGDHSTAR